MLKSLIFLTFCSKNLEKNAKVLELCKLQYVIVLQIYRIFLSKVLKKRRFEHLSLISKIFFNKFQKFNKFLSCDSRNNLHFSFIYSK